MAVPKKIIQLPTTTTIEDPAINIRKAIVSDDPKANLVPGVGKVLMLLGATGAGKSTLINGFVNYIHGVKFTDDYRYKLVEDGKSRQSQAYSQTKWITAYTFYQQDDLKLPSTLTIIDTPGYGDTEGLERDKQITSQIKEFFSIQGPEGIDHLDGIGFVVQAPLARLTPTQRYIFDSILSIFGKDISQNIFMMVTFADGNKPPVLDAIKAAKFEFQRSFKFNNSALFAEVDETDDDDDESSSSFNAMYWNMGEKSFENFLKFFDRAESVSLQLTKEVLQERESLECLIQGLQLNIQAGLYKADQLHQEERIIKAHEKDLMTNKDLTYEVDVTKQRKIDLQQSGRYVTNCLKCNMTCHYPCKIARDDKKHKCSAMGGTQYCKVCPEKCYWDNHVNNPYRFELYTEKETRTSEELKKRYEEAASKKTAAENVSAGLKTDMKNLYVTVFGMIRTANGIIQRLEDIALKPNPLSEIQYIDLLIDTEEIQAKQGFQRRIRALKNVRNEAKIMAGIKDEKKLAQKLKDAANYCWQNLKFW